MSATPFVLYSFPLWCVHPWFERLCLPCRSVCIGQVFPSSWGASRTATMRGIEASSARARASTWKALPQLNEATFLPETVQQEGTHPKILCYSSSKHAPRYSCPPLLLSFISLVNSAEANSKYLLTSPSPRQSSIATLHRAVFQHGRPVYHLPVDSQP